MNLLSEMAQPDEMAWQSRAECVNYPQEWFFPTRGDDVRQAQRVCFECPVRSECLEFALEYGEKHGIWGGHSERERRRIRRRRRQGITKTCAVCGVNAQHRPDGSLTCGRGACQVRLSNWLRKQRPNGTPPPPVLEADEADDAPLGDAPSHPRVR